MSLFTQLCHTCITYSITGVCRYFAEYNGNTGRQPGSRGKEYFMSWHSFGGRNREPALTNVDVNAKRDEPFYSPKYRSQTTHTVPYRSPTEPTTPCLHFSTFYLFIFLYTLFQTFNLHPSFLYYCSSMVQSNVLWYKTVGFQTLFINKIISFFYLPSIFDFIKSNYCRILPICNGFYPQTLSESKSYV